ncbi:lysoplasmalogenase [Aspergillus puulaauensis]|uniref:YhhN-like protein n=1 Tax=Aspergillus puulaauensis TaxID=1220207 RepID=A0A7R7XZD7_9EURO|nr:uncharacterized protein APUU_71213S [Aspergillus puulaauensis]BCS29643.1 hypothetical protein APUU_71213S [Aspergillus puulaauensis]
MDQSTAVLLLVFSLPCLVLSEHRSRSHAGTVTFKLLSSLAFLLGPFLAPATEWTSYRIAIVIGLLSSLVGDWFLLPSRKDFDSPTQQDVTVSFQLGVVAFAAAHIAYIIAFAQLPQDSSVPVLLTVFIATMLLAKWLGVIYPPRESSAVQNVLDLSIPSDMKPLVLIYAAIISSMFATAVSTGLASDGVPLHAVGAAMFVVSDVFVAKNAFGQTPPQQRGWFRIALGYGLYFWGQVVIAWTATL